MHVHPIAPVYNENSRVLILGSFPSVKSREMCFFYAHRQNRFWKVMAELFNLPTPETIEEKRKILLENGIALWDVIKSCNIVGSSDNTIRDVSVNDLGKILCASHIRAIFVNGKTAEKYYNKYIRDIIGREAVYLPSTSAQNASYSLEMLVSGWKTVLKHLD